MADYIISVDDLLAHRAMAHSYCRQLPTNGRDIGIVITMYSKMISVKKFYDRVHDMLGFVCAECNKIMPNPVTHQCAWIQLCIQCDIDMELLYDITRVVCCGVDNNEQYLKYTYLEITHLFEVGYGPYLYFS